MILLFSYFLISLHSIRFTDLPDLFVTSWFYESRVFESRRSVETPRRGGTKYATDTKSGNRASHQGLLTPSKDATPVNVDTTVSEHGGKTNAAATNNTTRTLFPKSHGVETQRRDEASCARRRKQGHHAIKKYPHQKQQTFSSRKDNFASNSRRREQLLMAGEGGKSAHSIKEHSRIPSRYKPRTFGTTA